MENVGEGSTVGLEAILLLGLPFGIEHVGALSLRQEEEGGGQPVGVLLDVEMDAGGIYVEIGFLRREAYVLVGVDGAAGLGADVHEDLLVRVFFVWERFLGLLQAFLALLVPLVNLLLPLLVYLGPWGLGHQVECVGAGDELAQRVGIEVGERHGECVLLVSERGIGDPVGDGVVLLVRLDDEAARIEVQSDDGGQRVGRRGEEEAEEVGLQAFGLEQMMLLSLLKEGQESDVIRQIVGVGHHADGVEVGGVAPDGVHAHVGAAAGLDDGGVEGYYLALLAEHHVAIDVFQSEGTIAARFHALDTEAA